MSIIRGPRPESGWYTLDKRISEDGRLGWAARGLLVFLLGKPDNWSVSVAHLMTQTSGARIKTGRDGVYALLKELEDAGYLQRHQQQISGKFGELDYIVSEYPIQVPKEQVGLPLTPQPEAAQPEAATPDTPPPLPANPPLTRTDLNQGLSNTNPPKPPAGSKTEKCDPDFDRVMREYPKRVGGDSPKDARKAWNARIKAGVNPEEIIDGVKRYAAHIRAKGKEHTEFVKRSCTFFGPGEHWKADYTIPKAANGVFHGNSNSGRRESEAERVERINREHDERERGPGLL